MCTKIDTTVNHYVKRNNPDSERQRLPVFFHMWNVHSKGGGVDHGAREGILSER